MKKMLSDMRVLSDSEIEMIHENSLKILNNIGVRFPNKEVLKILADHGAVVDYEKQVAKLPPKLVEKCLAQAAKASAHLLSQEDGMYVNRGDFKFQMCSEMNFYDYDLKQRRAGRLEDVDKGIVLGNELANIGVINSIVTPSDMPMDLIDVYSAKSLLLYAKKKPRLWIYSAKSAGLIVEMAKIAMGEDEFKRTKPLLYSVEAISPLGYSDHSLEIGMLMVKSGLNILLGPIPMAGATAPVTRAGVLTLANAETLSGITFIQCVNPGQWNLYNGASHTMDMKTTLCSFGSPNQILLGIAHAQLARRYGLPANCNTGGTDSVAFDAQCGVQHGVSTALTMASGINVMIDLGMNGADQCASFEALVIDNEMMDYCNYIFGGFEVSEKTIAYDLIEKVGIGGNFLMEEHTLDNMRDNYWNSSLFTTDNWDTWLAKNRSTVEERAHEKVVSILKDGYPPKPVFDGAKASRIEELVADAVAKL